MVEPEPDWRLANQMNYLKGATLERRTYCPPSEAWDHDHCAFCWAEFADNAAPDTLHEGYCTLDEYHWVCPQCFTDFHVLFEWQVSVPTGH